MKKRYKTLIIGATFFGLSRLLAAPEQQLLVSRTAVLGGEFVESLRPQENKKIEMKTPFGSAFARRLRENGFLDAAGWLYPAPTLFCFCTFLAQAQPSILLNTEVTRISKRPDGYQVTLFTGEDFLDISTETILDTTAEGVFFERLAMPELRKYLCAAVSRPDKKMHDLFYNPLSRLSVFRLPLAIQDDYTAARRKLRTYWETQVRPVCKSKILYTASIFSYTLPKTQIRTDERYVWIPSCGFSNLLAAIDEGQVISI